MKKMYLLFGVLLLGKAQAQQQQGRVVYEFTRHMQLRIAGGPGNMDQSMPRTHVSKIEVLFGNNQMLRRQLPEDMDPEPGGGEGGMQVRTFGMGADDITWCNFTENREVAQREFAGKEYLVTDSLHKLNWKLTGETKTILGYACQQAITTRTGKRSMMSMENGVMSKKEIPDTSNVVVWFAPAIPVPAGPDYQAQLPGLILEVDVNGKPAYKAVEVSPKVDISAIKEPKKGKKVSEQEFNQERDKMMEEMQRNNGGRRMMRIGN